jgi:hypothetical protein
MDECSCWLAGCKAQVVRLLMSGVIPFDVAHAEPDGVERGEGKRQHRADGSASGVVNDPIQNVVAPVDSDKQRGARQY